MYRQLHGGNDGNDFKVFKVKGVAYTMAFQVLMVIYSNYMLHSAELFSSLLSSFRQIGPLRPLRCF